MAAARARTRLAANVPVLVGFWPEDEEILHDERLRAIGADDYISSLVGGGAVLEVGRHAAASEPPSGVVPMVGISNRNRAGCAKSPGSTAAHVCQPPERLKFRLNRRAPALERGSVSARYPRPILGAGFEDDDKGRSQPFRRSPQFRIRNNPQRNERPPVID